MSKIDIVSTIGKVGEKIEVEGWVHSRRDHGKILFIDLRDRSGLLQVVFLPQNSVCYETAQKLRPEFVVKITGQINERPAKLVNEKIPTGKIEMLAESLEILNEAKTPPFELDKDTKVVSEELRLKYRYLDLRSERMKNNVVLRHHIVTTMREYLNKHNFLEIETPYITKGTPEGAREFIVPARLYPGQFYVLPQSPQQFKQLLMVSGMEKYYQVARCFRDEDQRGDRQAEFTQLDIEMSFIEQEDILQLIEKMLIELVKKVTPHKKIQQTPFPRLTYAEAIRQYNSDKPDLRKDKSDQEELAFCWVIDMPLFEYSETEKKLVSVHHPFTSPNLDDLHYLQTKPEEARAYAYDVILNGYELGGGSIRIHQRDLQNKIFELLGLTAEEIQSRFGHLLEAFEYGAPPHGGIALGLERLVMLLADEPNIREVMAFPKTGDNRDLMMGAPSSLLDKTLKEAHVKVDQK
ncbi:MAG: aspartate--tRNA ligase [Candidatus Buchananbacteria bacterium]